MPINFRAPLTSSGANEVFLDKTIADIKKGKLSLYKVSVGETEYIDDVQQSIYDNIQNISTLDGEAIKNTANNFDQYTEKVTPVNNDIVLINDSEAGGAIKKLKLANMIGGGSGGGGAIIWLDGSISPLKGFENFSDIRLFDDSDLQTLILNILVPGSYTVGNQILLKNLMTYTDSTSGNILFRTTTYLTKVGEDITSIANSHDSTNAEITVSASDTVYSVGDIDLTDSSGEINSVAVATGDLLRVVLIRESSNETTSITNEAKLLTYISSISFEG